MDFPQALKNTVVITFFATFGSLVSSATVAYGFAKVRFRGKDFLFMLCLSAMMIPGQVTMIPRYVLFKILRWLDTFLPLIVPAFFGGGPFYIFLLRQFFLTIPPEMDDAARIDGCGIWGTFFRIALPLSKPALAAVVIFSFFHNWNNFMEPLIYLSTRKSYPIAVALRFFQLEREVYWGWLMAASVVAMVPCLILFFFTQRYFIQGVVVTGVKG
jgi:multiple sugar transport system permease protein